MFPNSCSVEQEKPRLGDEDVCTRATNSHKFVVNFALCTNILHIPGSGIGDPIGTNPSFLFLVLFFQFSSPIPASGVVGKMQDLVPASGWQHMARGAGRG